MTVNPLRMCIHCGLSLRVYQGTWVHDSGDRYCFSTAAEPEGAVLNPEEVRLALAWFDRTSVGFPTEEAQLVDRLRALAARLEVSA